ncbi:Hypothetical predicted protein [Pelobates cultripes]|uniref:Uncharacterized protein n=1 Tax=Pelobates cultripes TaxID=61616 RepID=A0AAD1S128_PELCU|nr:Hypothetical predicted protein [Pelobates cultripes]
MAGEDSDSCRPILQMNETAVEGAVTQQFLMDQLNSLSQRLIAGWSKSLEGIRRDISDLGARPVHVEEKMEVHAEAHNSLETQVQTLKSTICTMESKIMDIEDCARTIHDLQAYLTEFFSSLAPDIPTDMLLLDREHRVPKPKHLLDSASRDVVLCVHDYHVKEVLLITTTSDTINDGFTTYFSGLYNHSPHLTNDNTAYTADLHRFLSGLTIPKVTGEETATLRDPVT